MDLITCCIAAIGLHMGSSHHAVAPDAPSLSNANLGAYAQFVDGVVVGALRNSLGRPSAYVAYELRFAPVAGFTPSLLVGGITGYPGAAIAPLVLPSVYRPLADRVGLRLSYIPKMRQTAAHVLHLSLEYRFAP